MLNRSLACRGLACIVATVLVIQPLRAEGNDDYEARVSGDRNVAAIDASTGVQAPPRALFEGFEKLSHGNQQIAMAFYYAQEMDGDPAKIWSLDRIAEKKLAGSAWVEIHARLRRDGSLEDVSLGQILSRGVRARQRSDHIARVRPEDVSLGQILSRGVRARQRSDHIARVRQAAHDGLAGLAPSARPGAFKTLSIGNRRIAEALFDSQTIGPQGNQAWSLDQIATAKTRGTSWKWILARLQADGLIVESGLGPIIAKHHRDHRARPLAEQVVVLEGAGRR